MSPRQRRGCRGRRAGLPAALTTLLALLCVLGPPAAVTPAGAARPNRLTVSFLAELRSATAPSCLESWAQTMGLAVRWVPGDSWVSISGSAAAVGRGFAVTVSAGPAGGREVWSVSGRPRVPAAACREVTALGAMHSAVRLTPANALGPVSGGLTPSQLLNAYDATPLRAMGLSGQGQTVVVFEADAYRPSDVKTFASDIGSAISLSAPFGNPGKVEGESNLDIETLHEIAPRASIVDINLGSSRFVGSSTGEVFAEAFERARQQWPGAVWSLSLGVCENEPGVFNATDLSIMQQEVSAAEQTGTSVFASSGDVGGLECMPQNSSGKAVRGSWEGVSVPAALPAVTAVGGTSLTTTSSGQRVRETAWTETLLSQGSGGGISTRFATPSWQRSAVSSQVPGREVPDVSADADPATGNVIVEDGHYALGGGTSLAAPIWAGFVALIDQYLRAQGKPEAGFLNPTLYALASNPTPYAALFDVTVGGNDFYPAVPGYDPVTGLGTPDVWNLARDLAAIER